MSRRIGWRLLWDVKKSQIEVQEGEGGRRWVEKVGELPPNVQEIIAKGGLEKWVNNELASAASARSNHAEHMSCPDRMDFG